MGIGITGGHTVLMAKRRGADFRATVMIGRQHHFLVQSSARQLFSSHGLGLSEEEIAAFLLTDYAEGFFHALGAQQVDSLDASPYEGASLIHDMNVPLPRDLVQKFSAAIDCGTVEHVFNIATGLKNSIDLLEVGGHYIYVGPANNMMGHGFYQLSPELFFGFLSRNGFADIEVYFSLYSNGETFFRVSEPRAFGGRIELVNDEAVQLCVIAKKVAHIDETIHPVQSDYEKVIWEGRNPARSMHVSSAPPTDPTLWAAITALKQQSALMAKWPQTLSPSLATGFENYLQYQLIDPARD